MSHLLLTRREVIPRPLLGAVINVLLAVAWLVLPFVFGGYPKGVSPWWYILPAGAACASLWSAAVCVRAAVEQRRARVSARQDA